MAGKTIKLIILTIIQNPPPKNEIYRPEQKCNY